MRDYSKIELVSFDAGGTLLYPYPSVGQQYAKALAEFGLEADPETIENRFGQVFREASHNKRTRVDENAEYLFWRDVVQKTFKDICPAEHFDQLYNNLFRRFTSSKVWKLFDDTIETLEGLLENRYRLVVLSNADSRFYTVFEEFGLVKYFEEIFISSQIGYEKPDRKAFQIVEENTSVHPENILHVGDSEHHDGNGAENAGWQAMVLKRDLTQLNELLVLLPGR